MLFTLAIAICLTGAVSATDSVSTDSVTDSVSKDGNYNTNYQWDNKYNFNDEKRDVCDEKYDDLNYKKDNARYEEPKCDTCRDYRYNCNCDEERKYDTCKSNKDNYNCDYDKKPECITCKNATVGDRVWNDSNANGIQDPNESGIAGVTVNLWTNVNNMPGIIINTTTTNATGNYLFTNVVPGAYWLEFLVPQALGTWIFSPQNQGTDDAIDSDANANGIAGPICLFCGECDPNWDVGLFQYATLGNLVWVDNNKNGIQDAGEPGQAGVTVNLWSNVNNAPGIILNTTTTDANGNYLFTNLVPGAYWLQFVLPDAISSWKFTLQNQGTDDAIDSDPNLDGIAGLIELASGEVDLTWDAGLDPGSAAGGDEEEPTDGAAGGEEEIIEIIPEEVAAAGEEESLGVTVAAAGEPEQVSAAEVTTQETGVPINYLLLAVLMILGGLFGVKRK